MTTETITANGRPDSPVHDDDLIDEAPFHAAEEASTWLRADLARHFATIIEANRCPTAVDLVDEIDRLAALAEQRCTALGPERNNTRQHRADGRPVTEHVTDRRFTTPAVLTQEQDLQHWANRYARPVETPADPQQAVAVAIAGHDQLVIVVGRAGTGKTRTTAVAVGALQARGRPVVAVAGFLTRHRYGRTAWPVGTTVILDES
ncbi:MAG: AAA family ATPase [Aquihabitans sp.]